MKAVKIDVSNSLIEELLQLPKDWKLTGAINWNRNTACWELTATGDSMREIEPGQQIPYALGVCSKRSGQLTTIDWNIHGVA